MCGLLLRIYLSMLRNIIYCMLIAEVFEPELNKF